MSRNHSKPTFVALLLGGAGAETARMKQSLRKWRELHKCYTFPA
jgi:hypothetical protein